MIPLKSWLALFHQAVGDRPAKEAQSRRWKLIEEEVEELRVELENDNREGIARELADLIYVCYGTAWSYDVDIDMALREVHAANMAKVEGGVKKDEHGKVQKPEGWKPPDMTRPLHGYWSDGGYW